VEKYREYLEDLMVRLLETPSPTGFEDAALDLVRGELAGCPGAGSLEERDAKGDVCFLMPGRAPEAPKRVVCSHLDTLGAMVKEIKSSGRLELARVGSYPAVAVVNEYARVMSEKGEIWGTIMPVEGSAHIFNSAKIEEKPLKMEDLEMRLDAPTTSAEETKALGVEVGDYVVLDNRVRRAGGFISARHLDDKASAAVMVAVARKFQDQKLRPGADTTLVFTRFEEVGGYGAASAVPLDAAELLILDVGIVGKGQASREDCVAICAKDASGPMDRAFYRKLTRLAGEAGVQYTPDVFVYYASDGRSAMNAAFKGVFGIAGPSVDYSHGIERTHMDGIMETAKLVEAYLLS